MGHGNRPAKKIGMLNFGLVTFVLLCYANEAWRNICKFRKIEQASEILGIFCREQQNFEVETKKMRRISKLFKDGNSKIRRILISRNSIQKGYHNCSEMV